MDDLITIAEVAKLLNTSPTTVTKLIAVGELIATGTTLAEGRKRRTLRVYRASVDSFKERIGDYPGAKGKTASVEAPASVAQPASTIADAERDRTLKRQSAALERYRSVVRLQEEAATYSRAAEAARTQAITLLIEIEEEATRGSAR